MQAYRPLFITVTAFFLFFHVGFAQTNPNLEIGFKPFGAYDDTNFDSVNVATGNLNLHIPLFAYPQRGALKAQVSLLYNSKGWKVNFDCTSLSCEAYWAWAGLYSGTGFAGGMVYLDLDTGTVQPTLSTWKGDGPTIWTFSAQTNDGGVHQLASTNIGGYESIDASGIYFNNPAGVNAFATGDYLLMDRNGNGYGGGASNLWQDTNGNHYSSNATSGGWTDTLGRSLYTSVNDGSGETGCSAASGLLPVSYAEMYGFPGPNGGTRMVKMCWANLHLQTSFNAKVIDPVTGLLISVAEANQSFYAVQSVIVNDGTSWATSPQWTFEYNDTRGATNGTNYGDLTQVTLPTGGTISYTWSTNIQCSKATTNRSASVLSRTINANDGMGNQITTYSVAATATTVTDPAGNDTVHHLTGLNGSCAFYDTEADYYKGSSAAPSPVLLKAVQTAYSWTINPFDQYSDGTTTVANVVPTSVTTKWPIPNTTNFLVSQVQTDNDNSFTFSPGPVSGGTYGRVTEKREYDYGLNNPGALLRKTDYTYAAVSGTTYLADNMLDLVTYKTVYNGSSVEAAQTTNSYDATAVQSSGVTEQHTTPTGVRGNLNQVQEWLDISGQPEVTMQQTSYYDTGMPYQSTDLLNHTTTYSYSPANYGAYVTQTQYPNTGNPAVTHSISGVYDFNTGLVTSFTDQNSRTSNYNYDILGRVTSASYPDGGSVGVKYTDTVPWQIQKTEAVTTALNKVTNSIFDGLGRVSESQLNDPDCQVGSELVKVDSTYGYDTTQNTHYTTTTTPYCDTIGTVFGLPSRTDSDTLGRTAKVTQTDGSVVTTSYAANTVGMTATVTDEAGFSRETQTDGLGRMAKVFEDPNHKNYETDYGYDTLDNLTSVTQKGDNSGNRNRTFYFDSLSRLVYAINPESGTISYTYSNSSTGACSPSPSTVCTKTAPAANQTGSSTTVTTYSYDALNRVNSKNYSDGTPSVGFGYDESSLWGVTLLNPIGRLTHNCSVSGCSQFSYDSMGRILNQWTSTPYNVGTGSFPFAYTYDLLGDMTSYNAEGVTFTQSFNSAGRVTGLSSTFSDAQHPGTMATVDPSVGYWPTGDLRKVTFGNGLTETSAYNNRLQPCRKNVNSSGAYFATCTDAVPAGNVQDFTYGFNASTSDNGNLASFAATGTQSFSRSYTYDSLNRLLTMSGNSGCTGLNWTYDAWGNRTAQNVTGGTCYPFSAGANTNNQLIGYQYDAAGNLLNDGNHSYTYDAENRITQVDGGSTASYFYDAEGQRLRKTTPTSTLDYVRNFSGTVLGEWQVSGSSGEWSGDYVYMGGKLLGEYRNGTTYFRHEDNLGSARVLTQMSQGIQDSIDYQPFGEQISGDTATTHKFTGKERDTESGLDNFGFRYNASTMGRFMTPDSPSYSNHKNPQSWNLYAYALNNPVSFRDADGHKIDCVNNATQCQADAAAATGNAQAASQVITQTTTTQHSFLGLFHWTTTETQIAITGDVNAFRALSPNASKLADLVQSKDTISVSYDQYAKPSFWANGIPLNGGSVSFTPSQGYGAQAFIDPTRSGAVYDPDAVSQGIPQANTAEEFGHEVLGHIWGEMFGGAPAGTRANMRDSIIGEDAVRALDPARGQKGIESHHNYNEMPPDKPQQ
jgi:RHS repeat-associated protein